MNLVSCNFCGTVLDKDKGIFPDVYDPDTNDLIKENAEWNEARQKYLAITTCPNCGEAIVDYD